MSIYLLMSAKNKYLEYFRFNNIDIENSKDEYIPKYKRLVEIQKEYFEKELTDEQANQLFGDEIGKLFHAIKRKEFVCKVSRVAFLGDMIMLAEFWGDYYVEIDFNEVLKDSKVQNRYPEYEKLRDPEVFHNVYPMEYHVYFGKGPDKCDVSSDLIWHFGELVRINEEDYNWVEGF